MLPVPATISQYPYALPVNVAGLLPFNWLSLSQLVISDAIAFTELLVICTLLCAEQPL